MKNLDALPLIFSWLQNKTLGSSLQNQRMRTVLTIVITADTFLFTENRDLNRKPISILKPQYREIK